MNHANNLCNFLKPQKSIPQLANWQDIQREELATEDGSLKLGSDIHEASRDPAYVKTYDETMI